MPNLNSAIGPEVKKVCWFPESMKKLVYCKREGREVNAVVG